MELFRQWLRGVIACALLVGLVGQLCPEGSTRKLARFTGALLMLLALLRPLGGVALAPLAPDAAAYREAVARTELELGRAGENALAEGIASEISAYIEDKAESLGARVRAAVSIGRRNGAPVPERVTLYGAYNETLAELIASELGVAKEKQTWIEETCTEP